MNKNNNNPPISFDSLLYKNNNVKTKVEIYIFNETVGLTQDKIAQLFGEDRSTETKYLKNVYKSRELTRETTCTKIITNSMLGQH